MSKYDASARLRAAWDCGLRGFEHRQGGVLHLWQQVRVKAWLGVL